MSAVQTNPDGTSDVPFQFCLQQLLLKRYYPMSSQSIASPATNTSNREISKSWLYWEILCNIMLAAFFLRFVLLNGSDLMNAFRLSSLLILMKVSADTIFHLFRRPARDISTTVYDWIIGIGGAYTAFFFFRLPASTRCFGRLSS